MSKTRLACLLVALGVGAAGLTPAAAVAPDTPAPAAPQVTDLQPSRALHAAALALLRTPDAARAAAWRSALLRSVEPGEPEDESSSRRDWSLLYDAGDVDGDRRSDLIVMRDGITLVRSGHDGRVLLRRSGSSLLPVPGAGAVRLVALDVDFQESDTGFKVTVRLQGLDRTGRAQWQHELSGRLSYVGAGPAYAVRFENLPMLLMEGQRDAAGRPAMLLGSISGAYGPEGAVSQLDLGLLGAADGSRTALPAVHGVGAGLPWAFAVAPKNGAAPCYATTAPTGPASRVTLVCDRAARWTRPAALLDPFVDEAGDFDGDGTWDLLVSTFGFEPAESEEPGRGTRVLAFNDGRELGASSLEQLCALLVDVNGDRQPDFMEVGFAEEGFFLRGVTLAGKQLWRRTIELRGSGSLEGHLGLDVDGDGVGDAFLRAEPRKGSPLAISINGRNGRPLVVPGVDALLSPGLRPRGADLVALEPVRGRLHASVLSGDRGRKLLSVRVPGPTGKVLHGAVAAVDVTRDGRRDLVLVSRIGDRRLTTAFSSRGSVLWQVSEQAAAPMSGSDAVVVVG